MSVIRSGLILTLALGTACAPTSQQQSNRALRAVDPSEPGAVFLAEIVESRPKIVQCPPARYPEAARQAGIRGEVVVELIVDTLGRPESASVRAIESPHDSLSVAAQESVLGCTFVPGRVQNRPVRVLVHVPVKFEPK
jgi:TonB family protein